MICHFSYFSRISHFFSGLNFNTVEINVFAQIATNSLCAIVIYSSGSIEIDHIDVSNLRMFSSRHNRIGSNRAKVTKSTVQWEIRQCLEIEDYAEDTRRKPAGVCSKSEMSIEQVDPFTLRAEFRYRVSFTAGLLSSSPRNQCEHFQPFNGVYWCFSHSNSIMENK